MLVPKGATLYLQVHYTTIGRPVDSTMRVGLYFQKQAPTRRIRTVGVTSDLTIPPQVAAHPMSVSHRLTEDIVLYGLYPHMHYRGSSAKYTIAQPGQPPEVLLSVPHYRFNWQTIYMLQEPRALPAGTVVTFSGSYDNSSDNPLNPDPTKTVLFGRQSWDEMFIGYLVYGVPVR